MELERKELHAYDGELKDSMERIAKCMPRHKESRYFLQRLKWFRLASYFLLLVMPFVIKE